MLILTISLISGCATQKPIEIITVPDEKTPLNLPDPAPVNMEPIDWYVITEENQNDVFSKLKEQGYDEVLFGLNDQGYEMLAKNISEIRKYMLLQAQIIEQYRNYYEPVKPASADSEKTDD